jgi:hypothetical protein
MGNLYEFETGPDYLQGLVSIIKQPVPMSSKHKGKHKGMPAKKGFKKLMADKADAQRQLTKWINANQITGRGLRSLLGD